MYLLACFEFATLVQGSPVEILSPKHAQSTTKRALKSAGPLRDEIQIKVQKLQMRINDVENVEGEVVHVVQGSEDSIYLQFPFLVPELNTAA